MHKSHARDGVILPNGKTNGHANGHAMPQRLAMEIVTHDLTDAPASDAMEQWARIRERMQAELGDAAYTSWIAPIVFSGLEGDEVVLYLDSKFMRDHARNHHGDRLTTLWQAQNPLIRRIDFRVDKKAKPPAPIAIEGTADPAKDAPFAAFDPSLVEEGERRPPTLPLDVFGDWWGGWLDKAGRKVSTPPDYFALPLLAAASACIGNARVAYRPASNMRQIPFLWMCSVGGVSSRKSTGHDLLHPIVKTLERGLSADFDRRMKQWRSKVEIAQQALEKYRVDIAAAIAADTERPEIPDEAEMPEEPQRVPFVLKDINQEAIIGRMELNPKGLILMTDELSGWFECFNRYNKSGNDRQTWIDCYNGGEGQVDRKGDKERGKRKSVYVERLGVAVVGTTQPDMVQELLKTRVDGLPARMLWSWPNPVFLAPAQETLDIEVDTEAARHALKRLMTLSMRMERDVRSGEDKPQPVDMMLTDEAEAVFDPWAVARDRRDERQLGGHAGGAFGKASGQALRLATVLELMWWAAPVEVPDDLPEHEKLELLQRPPPDRISEAAMRAAIRLLDEYFWPMSLRVFGLNLLSDTEANAQRIARKLIEKRPAEISPRGVLQTMRTVSMKDAYQVATALRVLEETGWLARKPHDRAGSGRRKEEFLCNLEAINQRWPAKEETPASAPILEKPSTSSTFYERNE